jgi:hypothetical protein
MRQPFKRNHLQHALAVSRWMREHQASGGLDPRSLAMEISLGGLTRRFFPQFTVPVEGGGIGFIHQLQPGINGFVGWYPFMPKGWPIAQSKLEFKQFAKRTGLRTPAWTHYPQELKGAFLVKRHISSLGKGQRGPFFAPPPPHSQPDIALAEGEYCEQFIMGQLIKAWYWCEQLAVVEVIDMPFVVGDGQRSISQLVREYTGQLSSEPAADLLALQGLTAQTVPAEGQRVCTAYQYMDESNPALYEDYNCLHRIHGHPLEAQLRQAGQLCWQEVPALQREGGCVSSLDGILDAQGRVWFLEANCNPLLHPAFYEPMMNAIFQPQPQAK